ncbi:MAG: hypothetical protein LBJ95_04575 [Oscillospiraceae bacterium]|jgi:hypothetical protein|nr:hypothetical protein [Oscillospiraceae bacterium]
MSKKNNPATKKAENLQLLDEDSLNAVTGGEHIWNEATIGATMAQFVNVNWQTQSGDCAHCGTHVNNLSEASAHAQQYFVFEGDIFQYAKCAPGYSNSDIPTQNATAAIIGGTTT